MSSLCDDLSETIKHLHFAMEFEEGERDVHQKRDVRLRSRQTLLLLEAEHDLRPVRRLLLLELAHDVLAKHVIHEVLELAVDTCTKMAQGS